VDVGSQQLFARAGLSDQQNAGVGPRGQGGLFHHALKGGTYAHHFRSGADQFAQAGVLVAELGLLQRVLDGQQDPVAAQRFLQEIKGPGARGLDCLGDGAVSGDHDRRRGAIVLPQGAQLVDAVSVRQADVQQVGVGAGRGRSGAEFLHGAKNRDAVSLVLQNEPQRAADVFLVVEHHDAFSSHLGRRERHAKGGSAEFSFHQNDITAA